MKGLLLFLGLAVVCASAHNVGFRVKFNVGFNFGGDFFFDVPRTMAAAVIQRWTLTQRSTSVRAPLVLYCHSDLIFCAYYDDNGFAAGVQVALPQDKFTDALYDWTTQGFVEWVPALPSGEIRKFWAISQYFVSEEYLQLNAEDRRALYDSSKLLQQDAIWLTGFYGNVDKVSSKTSDIANSVYTKQACIPWMGRHYYYNMTENTPCAADTMYPWFPLVHDGNLIGTGFVVFGKLPIEENARDWFERPPKLAVQVIVPDGPKCLYDLTEQVGLLTMHIYYIDQPWTLGCLFQ
ncbi:uncharacterized protein LOC125070970 [Vanessa atalanta]|uniref:uncharacterized protein LOC125070970 n=1 Tax=Vanessa atalanta TaxID=42275 RepID=UPI001FCDDD54|nr:uncharacterized protein LOC125070970 [Vanessa atalanta]